MHHHIRLDAISGEEEIENEVVKNEGERGFTEWVKLGEKDDDSTRRKD